MKVFCGSGSKSVQSATAENEPGENMWFYIQWAISLTMCCFSQSMHVLGIRSRDYISV